MEKNPTSLWVVAAVMRDDKGRVFLQKRPENKNLAGLWEFPGGKIDAGETPEIALARELYEELSIHVRVEDIAPITFASEILPVKIAGKAKHLILLLFDVHKWNGEVIATESLETGWFFPHEMDELKMPPADIPLVKFLQK
ncbi:hypothetical protein LPB140_08935 [Sphingorhabdus lutea]|uniref:8-oxo-dGTP diphosphatase n=1 Tax=Sphingorhabdus lutea TaxID=1913578 RepID=A0A1L3JCV3_9SPHN|nr:(deoxy)nucleoside triphosphate pyrophosphohydrolase [Sphingorhabdus lutea]APG62893.1 hypothetical protein LPB140_08935 [Sphingorhabdus lutea]